MMSYYVYLSFLPSVFLVAFLPVAVCPSGSGFPPFFPPSFLLSIFLYFSPFLILSLLRSFLSSFLSFFSSLLLSQFVCFFPFLLTKSFLCPSLFLPSLLSSATYLLHFFSFRFSGANLASKERQFKKYVFFGNVGKN